ncbi:MAG: sulfatase-like hydrolase/transferase [Planctomycetota bacterium]
MSKPSAPVRRPSPGSRPNILLVMTDQQRFDTIAALGNGLIRTPTLDRLCREGTAFTHAYTPSPVCVAARSALITGLAPHQTGCVDNMPTPTGTTSLMQHLAAAGYQTHGVGKMHFTPDPNIAWGFESRDISEEEHGPGDDYAEFLEANGYGHVTSPHGIRSELYYTPQPSQLPERLHHTRWVVDRSIDFLGRRDRARPFFLFSSFVKPHPPFENPTPWNHLYRGPDMPGPDTPADSAHYQTYWNRVQNRYKYCDQGDDLRLQQNRQAAYYGCISFIDFQLGRLLQTLGDEIDNTLILFTSDHGEFLGDYGCVGKRSMLDAACRVPMIARWPGGERPSQVVHTPTTLLDILPTCLAAAQTERTTGLRPDGRLYGRDLAKIADGHEPDRIVTSQFQRGRYAQYLAASREIKFWRSTPDRRDWITRPAENDVPELDVSYDPAQEWAGRRLERWLASRLEADGYTEAVHGEHWVEYEPPAELHDRDESLIYQDPGRLHEDLARLGEAYCANLSPRFEAHKSRLNASDPYRKPTKTPDIKVPPSRAHWSRVNGGPTANATS